MEKAEKLDRLDAWVAHHRVGVAYMCGILIMSIWLLYGQLVAGERDDNARLDELGELREGDEQEHGQEAETPQPLRGHRRKAAQRA